MKAVRALGVLALLVVAISCREAPMSPTPPLPPMQPGLFGDLFGSTGLLRCSDLPSAQTTATIGSAGGRISVGPHTLSIPPDALSEPTAITMTIPPPGRGVNAVRFEPHGLEFDRPAALTMSYANCNLLGRLAPKRIAYTTDALDILYYLLSFDNLFAKKVTGRLDHFSDYVIAW